jgi:hypothetical protein
MPESFPKSKKIISEKIAPENVQVRTNYQPKEKKKKTKTKTGLKSKTPVQKAYRIEKVREKHGKAYVSWSESMDIELTELYCEGKSLMDMIHFSRSRGAIASRIKKLELEEKFTQ